VNRIEETLRRIRPLGPAVARDARFALPIPKDGLGQLGRLVERLRSIYSGRRVGTPLRKLLLIAAADHGIGRHGVSRYPQASTAELVRDVLAGRAAVARIAPRLQVRAVVVDFGLAADFAPNGTGWAEFDQRRVAPGTQDLSEGPAMSRETALRSVSAGMEALEHWRRGWDVDLLGTGNLGLGASISACAIAAALTGRPLGDLLGCEGPAGASGASAASRIDLVRKALERTEIDPDDAIGVLAEYGGLEIGALAGAALAAAANGIPVLLDGAVSAAAAAVAAALSPASRGYFIASHRGGLPAHGALLEHMGLEPLLRLDLDLGEGAGAVLAMDLVEAAWELGGTPSAA